MIINYKIINELFRGFYIQRWNDRIRPMDLIEMDKHAHKMIIAWCIAKYEEACCNDVNWELLIKNGIYELLRRIIISDIKSPIYSQIKKHPTEFGKLNEYVFESLSKDFDNDIILKELEEFLFDDNQADQLTKDILEAAHIYASYWEFQIIKQVNPFGFQNIKIETELLNKINKFKTLEGVRKLTMKHTISNFIDLFGQLRFQLRWAQLPRVPKTSVLGHSMMVAALSYFFARENKACPKRLYNNFYGGLFHDLPEAVTRDIISPVKRSSKEFDNLIKDLEQELAEKEIFPLVEEEWIDEIKFFIIDEFENKASANGKSINNLTIEDINKYYNQNENNAYDGKLIRVADHLSAFLEAYQSTKAGISTWEYIKAMENIVKKYQGHNFGNVSLDNLYQQFEKLWEDK